MMTVVPADDTFLAIRNASVDLPVPGKRSQHRQPGSQSAAETPAKRSDASPHAGEGDVVYAAAVEFTDVMI